MKKGLFIISLLFSITTQAQLTFDDVTLPATVTFNSNKLVLNGGGIREKFFFDLYVGGLYLTKKSSDENSIINTDESMAIKLQITSGLISSKKMIGAIDEGFEKSTNEKTAPIATEIKDFKDSFIEEISVGDIYDITYTPNGGTVVYKNSKKVKTIKGLEFKKALFGIWLCDKPADEDLKEGMLGK